MFRKLIYILILIFLSSCPKDQNCPRENLIFQLPVKLNPKIDTFNIGDTIWIESSFSSNIVDTVSNQPHRLDSIDFFTIFLITQIDTTPFQFAQNKFEYLIESGNLSFIPANNRINLVYDFDGTTYNLKFAIIPKSIGVFNIIISSFFPEDFVLETSTICLGSAFDFIYKMNEQNDNNYHMILESPDQTVLSVSKQVFDDDAGYCFVVK